MTAGSAPAAAGDCAGRWCAALLAVVAFRGELACQLRQRSLSPFCGVINAFDMPRQRWSSWSSGGRTPERHAELGTLVNGGRLIVKAGRRKDAGGRGGAS
ncbi:MAG: hypothetical protein U0736_12545 [Gemmataceae bacterium]